MNAKKKKKVRKNIHKEKIRKWLWVKEISAEILREYWDNIKLLLKRSMEKAGIQEGLRV